MEFEDFVEDKLQEIELQSYPKKPEELLESTTIPIEENKFPIQISWKNLEYKVKKWFSRKSKEIISMNNMEGYVKEGQILAVIGPSGSGKSTFLNILADRIEKHKGEVFLNEQLISKKYNPLIGFVDQDYVFPETLTVYEYLLFNGILKLPSETNSLAVKIKKIKKMMEIFGLTKSKNTLIGSIGLIGGISGGERRRLAICLELLTNPSVVFLDEPTSGLDSKTSLNLIQLISKLAKSNRTIIITIHQPSYAIFNLFDRLLFMSNGQVAYHGSSSDLIPYFERIGYTIPLHYNPSDFIVDLITESTKDISEEKKAMEYYHILKIIENFKDSPKEIIPKIENHQLIDLKVPKFGNWRIIEIFILTIRYFLIFFRDPMLTISRLIQVVLMSLLLGLLYIERKEGQKLIQNTIGALFYILLQQSLAPFFGALNVFHRDKPIFDRERISNVYRVSSYYLGRTTAELPMAIIFPIIFGFICYWLIGLHPNASNFFVFLLILILLSMVSQSFGFFVSAFSPTRDIAMAIAPLFITMFTLFSGFYINLSSVPVYFVWILYLSYFRFGFEALIINEFKGRSYSCLKNELVNDICPVTSGSQVIQNLSIESTSLWMNILVLVGFFFSFRILGYLALRFLNLKKQ